MPDMASNLLVYLVGQLFHCSVFAEGLSTILLVKQPSQQHTPTTPSRQKPKHISLQADPFSDSHGPLIA